MSSDFPVPAAIHELGPEAVARLEAVVAAAERAQVAESACSSTRSSRSILRVGATPKMDRPGNLASTA